MRNVMVVTVAGALMLGAGGVSAQQLESILKVEQERNAFAQASQTRVDKLSEQTSKMLADYREVLKQIATLKTYNAQIQKLVNGQKREITSLNQQIDNVTVIDRQIAPLMLQMIESLDEFVGLDIPFLSDERQNRIEILRTMMDNANVANSEKFRRLLEAFQIENEYGRTIDAYLGELNQGDHARRVDFLRIGRLVLLYQTLDRSETGIWNPDTGGWEVLPDRYRGPVRQGLRMARKQIAPDLLNLPIPAPETAK